MTQEKKGQVDKFKSGEIEQMKILRVFQLINLLQAPIGKPVYRLAKELETDQRTIYRYFKLLKAMGFDIVKEFSKYKIEGCPGFLQCGQCSKQMNIASS